MGAICIYPSKISRLVTYAHNHDRRPCKRWDTPKRTAAPTEILTKTLGDNDHCGNSPNINRFLSLPRIQWRDEGSFADFRRLPVGQRPGHGTEPAGMRRRPG